MNWKDKPYVVTAIAQEAEAQAANDVAMAEMAAIFAADAAGDPNAVIPRELMDRVGDTTRKYVRAGLRMAHVIAYARLEARMETLAETWEAEAKGSDAHAQSDLEDCAAQVREQVAKALEWAGWS